VTDLLAGPPIDPRPLHDITSDWRRHGRPPITLPCVCNGPEVRAMSTLHPDIEEGVRRHQIEPVHIAYDRAHGIPLAPWQVAAAVLDGER
jgi:hypothetical protein